MSPISPNKAARCIIRGLIGKSATEPYRIDVQKVIEDVGETLNLKISHSFLDTTFDKRAPVAFLAYKTAEDYLQSISKI